MKILKYVNLKKQEKYYRKAAEKMWETAFELYEKINWTRIKSPEDQDYTMHTFGDRYELLGLIYAVENKTKTTSFEKDYRILSEKYRLGSSLDGKLLEIKQQLKEYNSKIYKILEVVL